MTQEWTCLKKPIAFVHTKYSGFQDLGLVSQVELWAITRSVFERFGADVESQCATQQPAELLRLDQAYDQWLQTWRGMIAFDSQDQREGVLELYFHSAKLYLYSHIYRGKVQPNSGIEPSTIVSLNQSFRKSALSVLRLILSGSLRLLDLPSYFSTMLAFTTVALIKAVHEADTENSSDTLEILRLLQHLAETLCTIQLPDSSSHPLLSISRGLEHASDSLFHCTHGPTNTVPDINFDESTSVEDIWNMDFTDFGANWMAFDEH